MGQSRSGNLWSIMVWEIILTHFQGLTYRQMSDDLGVPECDLKFWRDNFVPSGEINHIYYFEMYNKYLESKGMLIRNSLPEYYKGARII